MSWQQIRNFFGSQTGRLTLSYLGVIMFLTIIFSVVIYQIASFQIGAPLPQARFGHGGIGRELLEEFERLASPGRLETLRAIKRALDPLGIMNPGKLVR